MGIPTMAPACGAARRERQAPRLVCTAIVPGRRAGPRAFCGRESRCPAAWTLRNFHGTCLEPSWSLLGGWLAPQNALYDSPRRSPFRAARPKAGPLDDRMTDFHPRSTRALKRDVSADSAASLLQTVIVLWPFIWPSDRRDLKLRIWVTMGLLLLAKIATMAVPFTFKWATDALTGQGSAPVGPSSWLAWAIAAPVLMTLAYGVTRVLMAAFAQAPAGLFAKVPMNAVRRLAYIGLVAIHPLS